MASPLVTLSREPARRPTESLEGPSRLTIHDDIVLLEHQPAQRVIADDKTGKSGRLHLADPSGEDGGRPDGREP